MKWSPLQINMLPLIAIETQKAIKEYEDLKEKVSQTANIDDIQLLNKYRQSIQKRVQALDRFYQRKYQDETIALFHMLKLKLQRTIYRTQYIDTHSMSSEVIFNLLTGKNEEELLSNRKSHSPTSSRFNKNSRVREDVQIIRMKSGSKQKNGREKERKIKTEYSEMPKQIHIEGDLRDSSIYYQHMHNDTSFDDFEPLFQHDHHPIVNQRQKKSKGTSSQQFHTQNYPKKSLQITQNTQNQHQQQKPKQPYKKYSSSINFAKEKPITKRPQIPQNNPSFSSLKPELVSTKNNITKQSTKQKSQYSYKTNLKPPKKIEKQIHELVISNSHSHSKSKSKSHSQLNKNKASQGDFNKKKSQNILIKDQSAPVVQTLKHEQIQKNATESESNQFRFTIKMSKEEYMSLLAMKKDLLKKRM